MLSLITKKPPADFSTLLQSLLPRMCCKLSAELNSGNLSLAFGYGSALYHQDPHAHQGRRRPRSITICHFLLSLSFPLPNCAVLWFPTLRQHYQSNRIQAWLMMNCNGRNLLSLLQWYIAIVLFHITFVTIFDLVGLTTWQTVHCSRCDLTEILHNCLILVQLHSRCHDAVLGCKPSKTLRQESEAYKWTEGL